MLSNVVQLKRLIKGVEINSEAWPPSPTGEGSRRPHPPSPSPKEKERYSSAQPGLKSFHINTSTLPSSVMEMKCLITAVEKCYAAWPLLSLGEEIER